MSHDDTQQELSNPDIKFISDYIGSSCDATTIANEFQLLFYRMGEHIAHHLDHCNRFKEENTDQVFADTS
jgi:hypothetical protein